MVRTTRALRLLVLVAVASCLFLTGCVAGVQPDGSSSSSSSSSSGSHAVTLSWAPSVSAVAGYNAYRAVLVSGPFVRLNSSLILATKYVDKTVLSGKTYYYVTTAVDFSGVESLPSNVSMVTIPTQ